MSEVVFKILMMFKSLRNIESPRVRLLIFFFVFINPIKYLLVFNQVRQYYVRLFVSLLIIVSSFDCQSQTWETNKAKLDGSGCLTYELDANQNRIPDFSYAGYALGGVAIPEVPVVETISPVSGDNTSNIQDAINYIAANYTVNPVTGFRGALFLNPGIYEVGGQIFLNESGIVLRGSGDGRDTDTPTIIRGTGNTPHQRDLIVIGGGNCCSWYERIGGTEQNITTNFVPTNSRTFEVTDSSSYSVGDNIIIVHPCSNAWLASIDYGGTDTDPNWTENQYPIYYNRIITNIVGNQITIDAPIYNHLDRSLSQSYIQKYNRQNLVTHVGVENLKVEIESLGGDDENHAWNAISLLQVEDAWVQDLTTIGYGLSGIYTRKSNRVSVINVHSLDPVAKVMGGRMYNFHAGEYSNNILFDNCYARNGRHHFVTNGTPSCSGIVVLRSSSENPKSTSEGHRQWSNGILFDNLIDFGTYHQNRETIGFFNRGSYGNSHGWSAINSVLWNTSSERPGIDGIIMLEKTSNRSELCYWS